MFWVIHWNDASSQYISFYLFISVCSDNTIYLFYRSKRKKQGSECFSAWSDNILSPPMKLPLHHYVHWGSSFGFLLLNTWLHFHFQSILLSFNVFILISHQVEFSYKYRIYGFAIKKDNQFYVWSCSLYPNRHVHMFCKGEWNSYEQSWYL